MRPFKPDTPTLVGPGGAGSAPGKPGARPAPPGVHRPPAARRPRVRHAWGIPGLWSGAGGLLVLGLFAALAPGGPLAARASALLPSLHPLHLLGTAAALGLLGAASALLRLWREGQPLRSAVGIGLSLPAPLLAGVLLLLRLAPAAP